MELLHISLMSMSKTFQLKLFAKKFYESFDSGIVKKLRNFQNWAEKSFLMKYETCKT